MVSSPVIHLLRPQPVHIADWPARTSPPCGAKTNMKDEKHLPTRVSPLPSPHTRTPFMALTLLLPVSNRK